MIKRKYLSVLLISLCMLMPLHAVEAATQEIRMLNTDWRFALGHAADTQKDFGCGTEYFTYFSKAASIHNAGPYAFSFNDSTWQTIRLPHDWATTLPYVADGSHSHGYHAIGWKYPENSVGWYRRTFTADSLMLRATTQLVFDGIFRDARVWVNGFYLGHEESGYTRQVYDITDYLNLGDHNLICVRVDASIEEGWWYEGAGIYRNVWLSIEDNQTSVDSQQEQSTTHAFESKSTNKFAIDAIDKQPLRPSSPETARYTWSADSGFMVDGRKVELHGVNLHQDHAGVGIALPKGLMEYRLRKLQAMGVNAIRCSHNPASEDFLNLCDSLGLYVIEETRLMGSNEQQFQVLKKMIDRDKHHRCIILWSIGNEEWGLEWNEKGEKIARRMQEWVHQLDPTRKATVATSSGPNIVRPMDVAGYNYIMQNDVEGERLRYPNRIALGSEETTGCGTRGVYYTDAAKGHMASINRTDSAYENCIERGWKFYFERPWLAGLFYWTGFDYLGEPNPMSWPAVGSQFGLLDNCGFPKDEAYYLQAWWTEQPTLHILPHWNLEGHEGDSVDVWVYSNQESIELFQDGRSLGRQTMPTNGHLAWRTIYRPGTLKAVAYNHGKRTLTEVVRTHGAACMMKIDVNSYDDITVVDLTLLDKKGNFAASACNTLHITLPEGAEVLGCGNGDPACHIYADRWLHRNAFDFPAFNGHLQVILKGANQICNFSLE